MDTKQKNKAPEKQKVNDGSSVVFKQAPGKPYFIFKLRFDSLEKEINHVS
jgi:hypothetical protein